MYVYGLDLGIVSFILMRVHFRDMGVLAGARQERQWAEMYYFARVCRFYLKS